ncbi:MAG: PilZ domain-containing protein [Pyrinomonadaceae bacterium]
MPTDSDKRKYERKELTAEAALEFSSGKYDTRVSEIGLGGCYVDSIASVVEGEAIALTISSSGESQRFTGEIAYVLPNFGFGIRFTELTEENIAFLHKIID